MTKSWLIGLTAFAMMTGAALAQSSSSTSTTSTVGAPVGNYSTTKSQSIDSSGSQTDKTQTYSTGIGGTNSSSSTQTTTPAYVAPYSDTTTSHSTTTTIK